MPWDRARPRPRRKLRPEAVSLCIAGRPAPALPQSSFDFDTGPAMPPSSRFTAHASLLALVLASAWAGAATPTVPAAAAQCAACHGADGNNGDNSTGSGAPSLAGQLPAYIKLQLANRSEEHTSELQ